MTTPAHPEGPLAHKIASVLAIPYNDSALKHALGVLDTRLGSAGTERAIRTAAEAELVSGAQRALEDFAPTYQALKSLGSTLAKLENAATRMDGLVQQAAARIAPAVVIAKQLDAEKTVLQRKKDTATAFSAAFVLSDRENEVLKDTLLPIDQEFYATLEKAKQVHENGAVLLAESPEAAEQLISGVSKQLDFAYAKLKHSAEQGLRQGSRPDGELRRQIALLADRPLIFRAVLTDMSETRKRALYTDFMVALSNETEHGKPLDFYRYDPERYIGSVLAWVHSAIVNEYEHLSMLVDPDVTLTTSLADGLFANSDAKGIVSEMVDTVTAALDQPLRLRIGELVSTQTKVVVVVELANVLGFYKSMLTKYDQPTLMLCFEQLQVALNAQFERCLLLDLQDAYKEKLSSDLSPPEFWGSCLSTMRAILKSYEQSALYDPLGDEAIKLRIGKAVDPYYQQCETLAKPLAPLDRSIFLANCLDAAKSTFASFVFATWKTESIDREITTLTGTMVQEEYETLLNESGLADASDLAKFYGQFESFLTTGAMDMSRRLRRLLSPRVSAAVTAGAIDKLLIKYASVVDENAPHPVSEVRLLLA